MALDFTGQNIQGCSFKGQDLREANFRGTDIRGTGFSHAILTGANFTNAEAGVPPRSVFKLVASSFFLSIPSAAIFVIAGGYPVIKFISALGLTPDGEIFPGILWSQILQDFPHVPFFYIAFFLIIFVIFLRIAKKQKLEEIGRILIKTVLLSLVMVIATTFFMLITGLIATSLEFLGYSTVSKIIGEIVLFIVGILAAIIMASLLITFLGFCALIGFFMLGIAVGITNTVWGTQGAKGVIALTYHNTLFFWIILAGEFVSKIESPKFIPIAITLVTSLFMIYTVVYLGTYISEQAVLGNEKYAVIHRITVMIAARDGTSFRQANLTDAIFTNATLKNADFRDAKLIRTCWFKSHHLSLARVDNTYLQDNRIQRLVTIKEGQKQNFDRYDLRRLNLEKANLEGASFIDANLDQANLCFTNLSGAKLVRSQLENANLTGACLTGAYIEDWKITRSTKLNNVKCKYVYMQLPTSDNPNPNRMPSQGEFKSGEFQKFSKSLIETLDLYHESEIDLEAAIVALKSLTRNFDSSQSLEVVALEERGQATILQLKIPENTDPVKLKEQYFEYYYKQNIGSGLQLKSMPENNVISFMSDLLAQSKQPRYKVYLFDRGGLFIKGEKIEMLIDRSKRQDINTGGKDLEVSESDAFNLGKIED